MSELLKELSNMSGFISDLLLEEKDPGTRRGILELLIMVSEKIISTAKYKNLDIDNDFFPTVIEDIKKTETLITGYKQKTKTYMDLSDHIMDVTNEVEALILGVNFSAKLLPVNPSINQKIQ
jgi:hypothetical protein